LGQPALSAKNNKKNWFEPFFLKLTFCELAGIGNTLDPDFSFAKIAAPYAQVRTNISRDVLHFCGFSRGSMF